VRRRRAIRQLTDEQVARVRRAHREGSPSIHSLAREFGVADNALWQIIQGKSYKDVPDAR
jgi:transposase-like protein